MALEVAAVSTILVLDLMIEEIGRVVTDVKIESNMSRSELI